MLKRSTTRVSKKGLSPYLSRSWPSPAMVVDLAGDFKEFLRNGFDNGLYFRRKRRTEGKLFAFNPVNVHGARQTIQSARQLYRLEHAKGMGGIKGDIRRQPVSAGVPCPKSTGHSIGRDSVHQDDLVKAGPAVHQRNAVAILRYGFDAQRAQPQHHEQPSRIVPTIEIAATDDPERHA